MWKCEELEDFVGFDGMNLGPPLILRGFDLRVIWLVQSQGHHEAQCVSSKLAEKHPYIFFFRDFD